MNDERMVGSHHVEGWLMDVPNYRGDYHHKTERPIENSIQRIDVESPSDGDDGKERPLSMASIGSEDSVNLDELINANFTADMDDETDLPFLASLDLDDSREDFWKIDTTLDIHLLSDEKKKQQFHTLYYSSKKAAENDYLNTLSYSPPSSYKNDDFIHGPSSVLTMPSKLKVPRPALPISPKSISSSEGRNRSGSFSSENSLNSQSTVTNSLFHSRHTIYPSESTSTSSSNGSHSTATSGFLSRSYTTSSVKSENSRPQQQRLKKSKVPMVPSLSDYGRSSTEDLLTKKPTGLARRATHIPAPPSAKPSSSTSTLQFPPVRTKSTCVLPPKGRSVSRIGQPLQKRASHIPTPASTRSNSSLGHVSIFASNSNQTKTDYPSRPNTSMATPARSSPSPMYGTRQTNIRTNMRVPTKISSSLGRVSTTKRS